MLQGMNRPVHPDEWVLAEYDSFWFLIAQCPLLPPETGFPESAPPSKAFIIQGLELSMCETRNFCPWASLVSMPPLLYSFLLCTVFFCLAKKTAEVQAKKGACGR